MNLYVRRGLGLACCHFAALFAVLFLIVAVSKITVISPIVIFSLALHGGAAVTLFVAGRVLFRRL